MNAKAIDLHCEFVKDPLGIGEILPRLSWRMDDARCNARQTAWQIVAAKSTKALAGKPSLWDSGKVSSDTSLDIVYGGKQLKSRAKVFWKVRIWDADDVVSDWSEPASFELGLLTRKDWKAHWIYRDSMVSDEGVRSPLLRRTFDLPSNVTSARLYVTSCGLFQMRVNGQRVGDDCFTPGWTTYAKRIQTLTYDVTDMLYAGRNAIGGMLGTGWYAGFLSWNGNRSDTTRISLLAQLEVLCEDGSKHLIVTDSSWKTADAPIITSELYHGERYDARLEIPGWDTADFDDSAWSNALQDDYNGVALDPLRTLPVRKQMELPAINQTEPVFGVHVFDLGQNMVGWARIKVRGVPGQEVKIRFAEMLNKDGTLYTANYRSAKSTDYYICKGCGEEIWEPTFTFHGFRYIELSGLREKPSITDVTGVVLHSEMEKTGEFECSNPLVNRLQQNIQWGQRGNYFEVPTDCPQRDERLGWTGDAQVFIRTGSFNFNVAGFFTKWCVDLDDSRSDDGAYPFVAPNVLSRDSVGASAWGDAGVVCPWIEYLAYGDRRMLERHYEAMCGWIKWQEEKSEDLILNQAIFGDWLALDVCSLTPRFDQQLTNRKLLSTACFARTTHIMTKVAKILGKTADERKFTNLWKSIRAAFNREFVTPSGCLVSETQTAYVLALANDLLPEQLRAAAVQNLTELLNNRKTHLSTGFVGTPLLAPVLTSVGRIDLAYGLLLQKTYPSWLYSVLQGATTMWERWNSYSKEAGFGDVSMNSFNHYAYGAIGEWLYSTVAGIKFDEKVPGYKHIIIQPQPPEKIDFNAPVEDTITWAGAKYKTRYGVVATRWDSHKSGGFDFSVTIPPNTTATVVLPGKKKVEIGSGTYHYEF